MTSNEIKKLGPLLHEIPGSVKLGQNEALQIFWMREQALQLAEIKEILEKALSRIDLFSVLMKGGGK